MPTNMDPLRREIERRAQAAARAAAHDIEQRVRAEAPVDSGELKQSVYLRRRGKGWELGVKAKHGRMVDEGTKPHTITPKRKKGVLAFTVGGRTVFAKRVEHPGTRRTGFFTDNVDASAWVEALTRAFSRLR